MTKPIYIIGHKNPDTDSICAAIAYANLKKELGFNCIPARAGEVNKETRFVLDYFAVPEPVLVDDLRTRAKDLLNGANLMVDPSIALREAWLLMRSQGVKTLPVVDKEHRLLGLVTGGDLADKYLVDLGQQDLDEINVTVDNIVKTLSGTLLFGSPRTELKGKVVIGAMHADTMGQYLAPGCVVLVGDREKGQLTALEAGAQCLIVTGGAQLKEHVEDMAKEKGTAIISVPMDTFTAARMLLMSIPVGSIMRRENLVSFEADDLLDEVKSVMLDTRFRNYPVVDEQNRVMGIIARYHLLSFSKKKVILVDHNELSQGADGVDEAQILEVIDHHRVGGIQTGEPILFRNEPLGSTCTLVAKAYFENGITPTREMAGLMCAAILSDTVIFKSPTCTREDRDIAERLSLIAGIDMLEFGTTMFKHGASLDSIQDILFADFKEFSVGTIRIGIGQVSVMGAEAALQLKPALLDEMELIRTSQGLGYILLMITDLLDEGTTLLISGKNPEKIGEAFEVRIKDNMVYLGGVLSRKKQVVPPLAKYFAQP